MGWTTRAGLLVAQIACGPRTNPTPKETKILDWSLAQSDRDSIRSASLTDKAAHDVEYVDAETGVTLALHIETARAAYTEAGKAMTLPAVTALTATVVDARDLILAKPSCRGLFYDMAIPPTTTILECMLRAQRPSYDHIVFMQLDGSGMLVPGSGPPPSKTAN
jgi:hypothetical protein